MRGFQLLFMLIFSASALHAQNRSIEGAIKDTSGGLSLFNATVAIIRSSDSTLVDYTRVDKNGNYKFNSLKPDKYRVLISYPGFADLVHDVDLKTESGTLPSFALTPKSKLLESVIIRTAGAIRIKGDTTEFVADSFAVREGATVEELLKKLPGFQVNSRGEIVAQGQRVNKVLVDGEEFFGDDPTAATRNLSAKAVDRVQVFDNKTDQQQLTGITSGSEGKTVNIKLKEDQKKGSFGRVEGGSDFKNLLDARVLYNQFRGKMKFSAYATKSTTNTGSLNWEDQRRLGIEQNFEYDELSGYYYSFGTSDEFSQWSLRGLPDAYSAGLLYINKWNGEKQGINGNYRYNRLRTTNFGTRLEQNLIPGNVLTVKGTNSSNALNEQHVVSGKYDFKVDSLTSFKLTVTGTKKTTEVLTISNSETSSQTGNNLTLFGQQRTLSTEKQNLDNQLQYRQLFKKKGRLFLTTLRAGYTEDDNDGIFISDITYRSGGNLDSVIKQDQMKMGEGNSLTYGAKLQFSEPLGTKFNIVGEYSYNKNKATSRQNTFDKSPNGKYESPNTIFSNNFDFTANSHTGATYVKYNHKKLRATLGMGISSIKLNLTDLDTNTTSRFRFLNATPQFSLHYSPKQQSGVGINYRGSTRQPSLDQLQPLRNNNDPLNEFIGNPGLQVGFNHEISMFYSSYKLLAERGIWANFGVTIMEDAIVMSSLSQPNGKRITTPVNVDGVYNYFFWSEWNKGEGGNQWIHSVGIQSNGGRNISFINGLRNASTYYSAELDYGIRYEKDSAFQINISPKIGYNYSKSSLNPSINNNYWNYGGEVEASVFLPGKIELRTECEFDLRQQLSNFEGNPNIILWNAELSRKFLKKKNAKVSLVANDILDQNRGFNRIINSDRLYQETFQRLSRYFLLKLEWSFNTNASTSEN